MNKPTLYQEDVDKAQLQLLDYLQSKYDIIKSESEEDEFLNELDNIFDQCFNIQGYRNYN